MRLHLFLNKSVHENAAMYYEKSKEAKKKKEGLVKAIEETKKEIVKAQKKQKEEADKKVVKIKREKQWFEKLNWFMTSEGKLVVGGKNAQQNDFVFAKHMDDVDLFIHADIQGGSAFILKDGINATDAELLECAQFAASFSSAWKNANASVDVYAVKKAQLSKHSHGGYIPTGAFAIFGEKRWFKSTKVGLKVGLDKETKYVRILPILSKIQLDSEIKLAPSRSGSEKGAMAKLIAKKLKIHPDDLLEILPSGKTKIA